jgi:predicted Zn-dependent peptidase
MHHATSITKLAAIASALLLTGCPADKKPDPQPVEPPTTQPTTDAAPKRSIPPLEPVRLIEGQPPVTEIGQEAGVSAFKVGELMVLHKPTPANKVVSAQLYFVGGVARLDATSAGVEQLALDVAASGGTEQHPKDIFHDKLNAIGASISSFADRDYSGFAMKCVTADFASVFSLMTEVALTPAMPADEVTLVRERQLAEIDSIFQNPDSLVSYNAAQSFFKGHPYANLQLGTRDNVAAFGRDELLAWQRSLLDPSQMLLVVVADVPRDQLVAAVSAGLGKLAPSARPAAAIVTSPQPGAGALVTAQRDLPTHYILGMFPSPSPADPDYPAMVVAMDYLGDRLFEEVRTKRNLTYAVSAGMSARRANYGYLYVTATDPAATLPVIWAEVDKLKQATLPERAMTQTLNVFLTSYYMSLETNASQASQLANAQISAGDWRRAASFLDRVRATTPADIQRVAQKYMTAYHFSVVGPAPDKLDPKLFGLP